MEKIFSTKGLVTVGFSVFIAALVVFTVLPRLPDIQAATGVDFSLGALAVDACCDDGGDDGGGDTGDGDDGSGGGGDNGGGGGGGGDCCGGGETPPPPTLSVSCTPSDSSIQTGGTVTWRATVSGVDGAATFSWADTAGGTAATGSTHSWSRTYNSAGAVGASVIAVTTTGQRAEASCGSVVVRPIPQTLSVSCTPSASSIRTGETVTWRATVSGVDGAATFSWADTAGGTAATGSTHSWSRTYNSAGAVGASVIAVTTTGQRAEASCGSVTVTTTPPPSVPLTVTCQASVSSIQSGGSVTWTASPSGGSGAYQFSWSDTDGAQFSSGTAHSWTRTYTTAGTKGASVAVADTLGNTKTASCGSVVVRPIPQNLSVSCTPSASSIQTGGTVTWRATVSGVDGAASFSWADTAGGTASTGATNSWSRTYNTAGTIGASVIAVTTTGQRAEASCGSVVVRTTPPPPSETPTGTISANPNPCRIAQGGTQCASNITWSTQHTTNATVCVDGSLFANATFGSQNAPWIQANHNYVFTLFNGGSCGGTVLDRVTVTAIPPAAQGAPTCTLTANPSSINSGNTAMLSWTTTGATSGSINNGVGAMIPIANGSKSVSPTNNTTYTATVTGPGGSADCSTSVTVLPVVGDPVARCDFFSASPSVVDRGGITTLRWETTNASRVSINGAGASAVDGSMDVQVQNDTTYTLTAHGFTNDTCSTTVTVRPTVMRTLVVQKLGNGTGSVTTTGLDCPAGNTICSNQYSQGTNLVLNAAASAGSTFAGWGGDCSANGAVTMDTNKTCTATFVLAPVGAPTCSISAAPASIASGSSTTLSWTTANATSGSIDNGVGAMIPIAGGSRSVTPSGTTTYTATVSGSGGTANCAVTVVVSPQSESLRCDSFSASPSSIDEGDTTTLRWETTGATSVEISDGIGSVGSDGSRTVSPDNDTTYTLVARRGSDTATCSTSVNVDENNGGGGGSSSSSPRCELFRASDDDITAGERVTLRWRTEDGSELRIEDDRDNEIFETNDDDDVDDGEVTVRPTRDTRYTLTVERGSRDDECTTRIDVEDREVSLILDRDQQPLTSISLSQVPYTGFDAGPFLTTVFYVLLALWAASVTYVLVIKKGSVFGVALRRQAPYRPAHAVAIPHGEYRSNVRYPRMYAEATATAVNSSPFAAPVRGYGAVAMTDDEVEPETEDADTYLKERAHELNLILSNDAVRFILERANSREDRMTFLDEVSARAKAIYPREDGWVVVNRERIEMLAASQPVSAASPVSVEEEPKDIAKLMRVPTLAEAIVTGNVTAAYTALGDLPLVALADAVGDLDALFRVRHDEEIDVPGTLVEAAARLSDDQLEEVIQSLASAIDGVYRDEAAAVKLAIIKAIKAVA
ncbi:hypothetical protein HY416_00160 [Candidatus Kaiserbacteria bacterium]|nr:hypothetical protein [Candidatus Kaiserbacteria bacterium]